MAKVLSVNKNTKEIYEFYKLNLIDPKKLKGKNVLIIELGNVKYIDEIKNYAKNVCVIDSGYNSIFGDIFEDINTLKSQIESFLEKNNMPKFDVVIGNPPYEGKGNPLYLRILETVNKDNSTVIWICPTQWIKNYKDSSYLKNVKNNTCKNLISHVYVGNPFEGADVANDIGIFKFGVSEKYENYEQIKFEKFSNVKLAKSIIEKFENFGTYLSDYCDVDNSTMKSGFYVNAPKIRGHFKNGVYAWDWTTLFGEPQKNNFKFYQSKEWNHWKFKTKNECLNFIDFTEQDIIMFGLYIVKQNNNSYPGYFKLMPWFGDYTKKWTENEIAKKLKLTKEEVDYIHKEMKNFGWKAKV